MRYIPHTPDDIKFLLDTVGVRSVEALFDQIPENLRLENLLDLPEPLCELELMRHMEELAGRNRDVGRALSFLGGGSYSHHVPPAVDEILRRGEFYTAYTPYQPEVSQGTLQSIFEFQTLVCQLLGMDIANASMYDGATGTTEAMLMAQRVTRRDKLLVASNLHPEYREVANTYLSAHPEWLTEIPFTAEGQVDVGWISQRIDNETAAVVIQYPNFFGNLEPLKEIATVAHCAGALLVVSFSEALAFGLIKPPGAFDADIVAGEGHSFGVPMGFGGPHLGMFASRGQFARAMPGRLVGRTVDTEGRDAYVLTLSTREQHIRREKATSNICTNEGLCALAATVHLSLLGPEGLRKLGLLNHVNAARARKKICRIKGYQPMFPSTPFFNEFVLKVPRSAEEIVAELAEQGIAAGIPLGRYFEDFDQALLMNVTEMHTSRDIERLVEALRG